MKRLTILLAVSSIALLGSCSDPIDDGPEGCVPTEESESSAALCSDGIDNDCDGKVDDADSDCDCYGEFCKLKTCSDNDPCKIPPVCTQQWCPQAGSECNWLGCGNSLFNMWVPMCLDSTRFAGQKECQFIGGAKEDGTAKTAYKSFEFDITSASASRPKGLLIRLVNPKTLSGADLDCNAIGAKAGKTADLSSQLDKDPEINLLYRSLVPLDNSAYGSTAIASQKTLIPLTPPEGAILFVELWTGSEMQGNLKVPTGTRGFTACRPGIKVTETDTKDSIKLKAVE